MQITFDFYATDQRSHSVQAEIHFSIGRFGCCSFSNQKTFTCKCKPKEYLFPVFFYWPHNRFSLSLSLHSNCFLFTFPTGQCPVTHSAESWAGLKGFRRLVGVVPLNSCLLAADQPAQTLLPCNNIALNIKTFGSEVRCTYRRTNSSEAKQIEAKRGGHFSCQPRPFCRRLVTIEVLTYSRKHLCFDESEGNNNFVSNCWNIPILCFFKNQQPKLSNQDSSWQRCLSKDWGKTGHCGVVTAVPLQTGRHVKGRTHLHSIPSNNGTRHCKPLASYMCYHLPWDFLQIIKIKSATIKYHCKQSVEKGYKGWLVTSGAASTQTWLDSNSLKRSLYITVSQKNNTFFVYEFGGQITNANGCPEPTIFFFSAL